MADEPRAAPPDLLATIKDDLNIPGADTSQDEWLQRRIDGVWARMEAYTFRRLCSPPTQFSDDWGQLVDQHYRPNQPPLLAHGRRGSIFLRQFPVVSIDTLVLNGDASDAANVVVDKATGKLLCVDGTGVALDLGCELLNSKARITYTAGWATVPADLYECLQSILQTLWISRQAQIAGLGGSFSKVSVIDVGDVEIAPLSPFAAASAKAPGGAYDPLLGPYTATLDVYVDHRSGIGADIFPTTVEGP